MPSKWIPVEERLPEVYDPVLVTEVSTSWCTWFAYFTGGEWLEAFSNGSLLGEVIAWKEIDYPEPYQKKEDTVDQNHVTNDPVNHPAHYTSGKIEVIDFIEDQSLPYHLGNAIKYICRAGKKDPLKEVEDLEKALWYIRRYKDYITPKKESNGQS